jgi:hypothetical protein
MRTAKQILTAIVALTLLSSGLPMFSPEDANRDKKVDLEDAILNIRDFAKTADSPDGFMLQAEKIISTLRVLAGVKTNIGTGEGMKSKAFSASFQLFYLPTTIDLEVYSDICFPLNELSFLYQSISVEPQTPPPEESSFLVS